MRGMKTIGELNNQHAFQQEDQSLRILRMDALMSREHMDVRSDEEKANSGSELPLIEIQNKHASATISLQGAHLLSWQPVNEKQSVIWLSEDALFAPGKSIRGGIPVCWPWFGAHPSHADYPAHGFARTSLWQIVSATPLDTGETQITFKLDTRELNEPINTMWPQPTVVEYSLTIGRSLILELTTTNHSDQAITLGQALHTYFAVDDIAQTTVEGLDGKTYLDKPQNFARKTQTGPVTFNAEVDRIYLDDVQDVLVSREAGMPGATSVVINDSKRKITISKQGSRSTVVWNPGQAVAEKMGDLGKDGYQKMVCVESANAAEDVVSIQPGNSHSLHVEYDIESLV